MSSECVFCRAGLTGTAAEEHIFPQWLLDYLGIPKTEQMFQGVGNEATLDTDDERGRVHGTWRFVEGRVCRTCNTGWLSDLENDVRPGLEVLIKNAGRLIALTRAQRLLLARWAAKTAFLIANVSPFKRPVPPGHLWAMNNGGSVPDGVTVFGGQSGTSTKTAYLQSTMWKQYHRRGVGVRVGAVTNAYKIGFQIMDLMLLAAFVPQSGVEFITAAGVHIPLNPQEQLWPCGHAEMPDKEQPPLWIFTRSLSVLVS